MGAKKIASRQPFVFLQFSTPPPPPQRMDSRCTHAKKKIWYYFLKRMGHSLSLFILFNAHNTKVNFESISEVKLRLLHRTETTWLKAIQSATS